MGDASVFILTSTPAGSKLSGAVFDTLSGGPACR
jgi:hypothetical protein